MLKIYTKNKKIPPPPHIKNGLFSIIYFKKHHLSLGRSMIEMLGVLAIIGVLSIGGLYAYRQVMLRYHTNQIQNFISMAQLISKEQCIDNSAECSFKNQDYYKQNRKLLCEISGQNEWCKINPEAASGYMRFPTKSSNGYVLWNFQRTSNNLFYFYLSDMLPSLCAELVSKATWQTLGICIEGTCVYSDTEKILAPEKLKTLIQACHSETYKNTDHARFYVIWGS